MEQWICFNQKPLQAPTARSARSFSRSDLRGTAELQQMGDWKIGVWLSFCDTDFKPWTCGNRSNILILLTLPANFLFGCHCCDFSKATCTNIMDENSDHLQCLLSAIGSQAAPVTLVKQDPGNGSSTSRPWSHLRVDGKDVVGMRVDGRGHLYYQPKQSTFIRGNPSNLHTVP